MPQIHHSPVSPTSNSSFDFELVGCAETLFVDLPFEERVRKIDSYGLAVDIWTTDQIDVNALKATGARFSSMTGYVGGDIIDPVTSDDVVESARLYADKAVELGVPRLNFHPAELIEGVAARPRYRANGEMWTTALRTLERLADVADEYDVVFCLENLNSVVDHPGVPLARVADTRALVAAVGSPRITMMLDLYHAQLSGGNLIQQLEASLPYIGEIQVADVPGRLEPGTGEINFANVAHFLADSGYSGPIGLEGFASETSELAIERFLQVFK